MTVYFCWNAVSLAIPYHWPYRVINADSNAARVQRVYKLQEETILVSLDRLRRCLSEVPGEFWPPDKQSVSLVGRDRGQGAHLGTVVTFNQSLLLRLFPGATANACQVTCLDDSSTALSDPLNGSANDQSASPVNLRGATDVPNYSGTELPLMQAIRDTGSEVEAPLKEILVVHHP